MKNYNGLRHIFLYDEDTPIAVSYEGAYKLVKAVSDDGKHYFEFTVNQDDYGNSLKELCAKFENFCVEECGFDDCRYCEIWTTYAAHSKITHIDGYRGEFYNDTLERLLSGCSWATIKDMEFDYNFHCSHLRREKGLDEPPLFDEWAVANGYTVKDEPFATRKLFQVYNSSVRKKKFTEDETKNITEFIQSHIDTVYCRAICSPTYYRFQLSAVLSDYLDCEHADAVVNAAELSIQRHLYILEGAFMRLFLYDRKAYKRVMKSLYPAKRKYSRLLRERYAIVKRYVKDTVKDLKPDWD